MSDGTLFGCGACSRSPPNNASTVRGREAQTIELVHRLVRPVLPVLSLPFLAWSLGTVLRRVALRVVLVFTYLETARRFLVADVVYSELAVLPLLVVVVLLAEGLRLALVVVMTPLAWALLPWLFSLLPRLLPLVVLAVGVQAWLVISWLRSWLWQLRPLLLPPSVHLLLPEGWQCVTSVLREDPYLAVGHSPKQVLCGRQEVLLLPALMRPPPRAFLERM